MIPQTHRFVRLKDKVPVQRIPERAREYQTAWQSAKQRQFERKLAAETNEC